jgi:hypothetical protein
MSSPVALETFLAEPRNVIVAGIRKDGRPHLSPNWFLWDGAHFFVSTTDVHPDWLVRTEADVVIEQVRALVSAAV